MPSARQTEDSDLSQIVQAIRRRIWVVILCFAAATLAAVALTARAEERYEATSSLLLRAAAGVEPQRAVDTNLQLLSLPVIAERTAEQIQDLSAEDVEASVTTSQQGESDILEITANASSPEEAAEIANAFSQEFLAFREGGGANRERLQTGRIEVVESAKADSSPVSPKPVRNIAFGALIGLVLGIGLALLLEQLDRRLTRRDDLTEATGWPLLATVPKRPSFDREHLGHNTLSPADTEIFRILRTNLRYFKINHEIQSVVVTSAEPGEGKTLVSLGLALAAVTTGERVLLIEADLRDPGLTDVLDLPRDGGLSWLLSTGSTEALKETVVTVNAGDLADALGDSTLDVVPAGAIPPNPTELVESRQMREVIKRAVETYDFVVIDTPPVLAVSDAIPLIMASSGVLAVSGLGVSTRTSAADLTEQLERLGAPVLGLVANFAERTGRSYDGYGYGRPPDLELMRPPAKPN